MISNYAGQTFFFCLLLFRSLYICSPQTSSFEALLRQQSGASRSYRYNSEESVDMMEDIDEDDAGRSKILGAIQAKVRRHYGR